METAVPILIFFVILGVVIAVHEFGHFIMARRAGMFVKEFALGMGPRLLTIKGKKKSQYPIEGEDDVTHFTLRLLPIGGFCSVRGQDDEMPDDPEAMGNKSISKRALFMFGGSLFNFIFALILFFGIILATGYIVPQASTIIENSPAYHAGMMIGDRVTHINGSRVSLWENFRFMLDMNGGNPMHMRVNRGGQNVDLIVTPVQNTAGTYVVGFGTTTMVGFMDEVPPYPNFRRVSVFGSFVTAVDTIAFNIRMPFRLLARLATNQPVPDGGGVMGPIGIAGIVTEVYQGTIQHGFINTLIPMLMLGALISVAVGTMNLMPIPALDGARLLFLLIEAIRRKPVPQEREAMVHFVGIIVIIALGVFIAYRDIVNLL